MLETWRRRRTKRTRERRKRKRKRGRGKRRRKRKRGRGGPMLGHLAPTKRKGHKRRFVLTRPMGRRFLFVGVEPIALLRSPKTTFSIVGERSSLCVPTTTALPSVAATHTTLHWYAQSFLVLHVSQLFHIIASNMHYFLVVSPSGIQVLHLDRSRATSIQQGYPRDRLGHKKKALLRSTA